MAAGPKTTLELIHDAAKAEFLAKGFRAASLRSIVKAGRNEYRVNEKLFHFSGACSFYTLRL